jgi:very-short-patch-repair endonuclease
MSISKRKTTEQFIADAREVHGDKYDYSHAIYVNGGSYKPTAVKVKIICPEHGMFEQSANAHTQGQGCPGCGLLKQYNQPHKLTTETFIKRALEVHKKKYNYTEVIYKTTETKLRIICPEHGLFLQSPHAHLAGRGCPYCSGRIRHTTESFIAKAKQVHGERFDYQHVEYYNLKAPVQIICPEGHIFEQQPILHLNAKGCPKCRPHKLNTKIIISRSRKIHGDKYDYSLVNYQEAGEKIKIICPIHGVFKQSVDSHINGRGCRKCGIETRSVKNTFTESDFLKRANKIYGEAFDYSASVFSGWRNDLTIICKQHGPFNLSPYYHTTIKQGCPVCSGKVITTAEFKKRAKEVHGNLYDYSKVRYRLTNIKVAIKCKKHGFFEQSPGTHLAGSGCPSCNASKGERRINQYLAKTGLFYEVQKRFPKLRIKFLLAFDFFVPEENLLIEYDGAQHFIPVKKWGGEKNLQGIQHRDSLKEKFAKKYGYRLLRINYTQFEKIEEILSRHIKKASLTNPKKHKQQFRLLL